MAKVSTLLMFLVISVIAFGGGMYRPVALDKNSRTSLYVLDSNGAVLIQDKGEFRPIASIPFGSRPVDLVSVRFGNQDYIFVCSTVIGQQETMQQNAPPMQQNAPPMGPAGYGLITQFNSRGGVVRQWRLPDLCGGFDITAEHIVYFAGAREPVVFTFSADNSHPNFHEVGYVKGARTLGPLIFDNKRNRIYIGDVASGAVFILDPDSRNTGVLTTAFAEPAAFALSPDRSELYVADSSAGTISKLSLNVPSALPSLFTSTRFRRPSGLAPGFNGHLWVADTDANQCVDVSPSPQLTIAPVVSVKKKPAPKKTTPQHP